LSAREIDAKLKGVELLDPGLTSPLEGIAMSCRRTCAFATAILLAVTVLPLQAGLDQGSKNSEVSMLQDAYVLLSQANHDYDGHRVKAMKSIHKAAVLLKVNLQAKGDVHENQGSSDEQLQKAQKILKQARTFAADRNQKKMVQHIDAALGHLSAALATK
jgi:hypothetical protein